MNNPPVKKTQLTVRIPDNLVARIDEWVSQRVFESRSEMVTTLLAEWLSDPENNVLWTEQQPDVEQTERSMTDARHIKRLRK